MSSERCRKQNLIMYVYVIARRTEGSTWQSPDDYYSGDRHAPSGLAMTNIFT